MEVFSQVKRDIDQLEDDIYDRCPMCQREWAAGCHIDSCTGKMCPVGHEWYVDRYKKVIGKSCGHELPPLETRSPFGMCA